MSRFTEVFPKGKAFLPVIHVLDEDQALRNALIALENGADGFFLIGHGMTCTRLGEVYEAVRSEHQKAWIGVNFLDLPTPAAVERLPTASGVWTDDAMIDMASQKPAAFAELQWRIIHQEIDGGNLPASFLYFGGVHFKGQDQSSDPAEMARIASPYMDVVTTSGPRTGQAADLRKIELMKRAMGDEGHLGCASGCTPENVGDYKPYVDAFLVATGISDSPYDLNPRKTELFAHNCR